MSLTGSLLPGSLLLAIVLLVSPAAAQAAGERAEFEAICRSLKESEDPQYGELRSRALRQKLEQSADLSPEVAVSERSVLGVELLELGHTAEAVRHLSAALETARAQQLDPRIVAFATRFLALAYLQVAEDLHCVGHHTAASCILPLAAEAVHRRPEPARRAGDLLLDYLSIRPDDRQARWLLNLARMISGDHPRGIPGELLLPAGALAPEAEFPAWRDRAPELGVNAFDLAGGAVMDDFDGDGRLDLVSSTMDPCGGLKAFRNDGRGGFEDVAEAWGLDEQLGGLNLVHADYDNDGDLDLFVLRGAWQFRFGRVRNSLLRNDLRGSGRFTDVTRRAGVAEPAAPTQTGAWADYDGDGDLDLYIGNEAHEDDAWASQLFRNDGAGDGGARRFTDVTAEAGVANRRYAKGVAWGDYDDDGDPDLYVSNIGENRLYRNDGGRFTDVASQLGVSGPHRSLACWFFDFDNDGDLDLWVADYSGPVAASSASYFGEPSASGEPLVYRNDGPGPDGEWSFKLVSREIGLERPLLPMGANYGDLDNDGWLDVYLGTGEPAFEALVPNAMYRNVDGRRFQEITFAGGFGHLQKGHGVAFGDLDNDGDQDLFHQLGGFFPADGYFNALFENPTAASRWITLRFEGRRANRFGLGARVTVRVLDGGRPRTIHAVVSSGGSFGGSSLQLELGLGGAERIEELIVRWPGSGTRQSFENVAANRVYRLVEGEDDLVGIELPAIRLGGTPAVEAH